MPGASRATVNALGVLKRRRLAVSREGNYPSARKGGLVSGLLNTVIILALSAAGSADPSTGLHRGVSRGEVASVRLELGKGADPNRKTPNHLTPLHLAARQGHLEIAQLLLQSGADPNRRQDPTGSTPLHLAVETPA